MISRFRVSNSKSGYRPINAPYMIEFTLHTTIEPKVDAPPTFPQYAYEIVPLSELHQRAGDTSNFVGKLHRGVVRYTDMITTI